MRDDGLTVLSLFDRMSCGAIARRNGAVCRRYRTGTNGCAWHPTYTGCQATAGPWK